MNALLTVLFFIYFWLSCAVLYTVNVIICLVTAPFDPLRHAVHSFSCYWGYHYFQINPFWKMKYEGVEQVDPRKTYVFIANHQSLADILVCYGLHRYFKWVSKKEVFSVPIIGWNMYLNQYVCLQRGDMKSIKEMMQTCKDWLKKGASVILFPEGTRSPDGEMQAFRDGAFRLAVDLNLPVVPVVIDGTAGLLPKGKKTLKFNHEINIKVLPPVDPAQFEHSSGKMRTYVHKLMQDELCAMRGQPPKVETADKKDVAVGRQ